jgi:hypothetical protein
MSLTGFWCVIVMWFRPVCSDTTATKEVWLKERKKFTQETGEYGKFIKCSLWQEVFEAVIVFPSNALCRHGISYTLHIFDILLTVYHYVSQ